MEGLADIHVGDSFYFLIRAHHTCPKENTHGFVDVDIL